jgi:hypothetical protein
VKLEFARRKLDALRATAFAALDKVPGKVGAVAREVNETLGRPLAPEEELADRRGRTVGAAATPSPALAVTPSPRQAAPVIVYHLDKHRRDLPRLTQVLDASEIPYRMFNLEGDVATQTAVRRDGGGRKLPLVFVAGDCIGAREELDAMDRSGELKRRVWG